MVMLNSPVFFFKRKPTCIYMEFISSACGYYGKNMPQKGKVLENNECRKALVIFADVSLLRQIFPILTTGIKVNYILYFP